MYDKVLNRYMIANIRMMPLPTNEPEHFEDWRPFMGYTDVDGCVVICFTIKIITLIVAIQSRTNDAKPKCIL